MASLQGTLVARRLIMGMSEAVVSTMEMASSPAPSSNSSSSIGDIGSYLLSRSKVKPPTTIVILLLITFFLLGSFSVYFRRCHANQPATPPPPPPPTATTILVEHEPPLALPEGLDMKMVESLQKIVFSSSSSSSQLPPTTNEKKQSECAICLEVFEEEETLRVIPRCGHIFHCECIKKWLLSQTSCPLCRHSLLLLPLRVSYTSSTQEEEHEEQQH